MLRYKKIDCRNLKTHYPLEVGHLYFRPKKKRKKDPLLPFEQCSGQTEAELYRMIKAGEVDVIWIEGKAPTSIEVD